MSTKEHLYSWVLPGFLIGIFMVLYFSGNPDLVALVAPPGNREWGILENLQLGIILSIILLALHAALTKTNKVLKLGYGLVAAFGCFIFLEEIDYGVHFAQLIVGDADEANRIVGIQNLHNRGNNANIFKRSIYGVMALLFVLAPLVRNKVSNSYLRYLIPKPRIVLVAGLAILGDRIPRLIVALQIREDGGLGIDIGEFGEVMIYYIFLIYLVQLIFSTKLTLKKLPSSKSN